MGRLSGTAQLDGALLHFDGDAALARATKIVTVPIGRVIRIAHALTRFRANGAHLTAASSHVDPQVTRLARGVIALRRRHKGFEIHREHHSTDAGGCLASGLDVASRRLSRDDSAFFRRSRFDFGDEGD